MRVDRSLVRFLSVGVLNTAVGLGTIYAVRWAIFAASAT